MTNKKENSNYNTIIGTYVCKLTSPVPCRYLGDADNRYCLTKQDCPHKHLKPESGDCPVHPGVHYTFNGSLQQYFDSIG